MIDHFAPFELPRIEEEAREILADLSQVLTRVGSFWKKCHEPAMVIVNNGKIDAHGDHLPALRNDLWTYADGRRALVRSTRGRDVAKVGYDMAWIERRSLTDAKFNTPFLYDGTRTLLDYIGERLMLDLQSFRAFDDAPSVVERLSPTTPWRLKARARRDLKAMASLMGDSSYRHQLGLSRAPSTSEVAVAAILVYGYEPKHPAKLKTEGRTVATAIAEVAHVLRQAKARTRKRSGVAHER